MYLLLLYIYIHTHYIDECCCTYMLYVSSDSLGATQTPVPGDSARYIQRVIARDDLLVLS